MGASCSETETEFHKRTRDFHETFLQVARDLAEWGLYSALAGNLMNSLTGSFLSLIPFRTVMLPLLVAYLGIGVLIGVFGGVSAIRNYLKV